MLDFGKLRYSDNSITFNNFCSIFLFLPIIFSKVAKLWPWGFRWWVRVAFFLPDPVTAR